MDRFEIWPVSVWRESVFALVGHLFRPVRAGSVDETFARRYRAGDGSGGLLPPGRLPPAARAWLVDHWGWTVLADRGQLLVFQENRLCKPASLPAFLAAALDLRRAITEGGAGVTHPAEPRHGRDRPAKDAGSGAANGGAFRPRPVGETAIALMLTGAVAIGLIGGIVGYQEGGLGRGAVYFLYGAGIGAVLGLLSVPILWLYAKLRPWS